MKIFVKIVLNTLFVLTLVLFSISLTLKFQILDPNFWKKTFDDNQIYSQLSVVIKDNLNNQVAAGGGIKSDTAPITSLVTPENLQDFIENNIDNVLGFINGKNKNILVYIPVDKIPVDLMPPTQNKVSKETKLQDLLTEFNIQGISASQIEQIRVIGIVANYVLVISTIVAILILIALKFSSLSIFLGGLFTGIGAGIIFFFKNVITLGLSSEQNTAAVILRIVAPPVLQRIYTFWLHEAVIIITFSIILFFIKRIYNIKSK